MDGVHRTFEMGQRVAVFTQGLFMGFGNIVDRAPDDPELGDGYDVKLDDCDEVGWVGHKEMMHATEVNDDGTF